MFGLLFSILFLFVGASGTILSLSGVLNSYQQKKLEYIAYRNQVKSKNILDAQNEALNIPSEADYYKSKGGVSEGAIDISFAPIALKSDLLSIDTYKKFASQSYEFVSHKLSNLDFGIIWNQVKIWSIKTAKTLKVKYLELVSFLIKITQPVDNEELEQDKSRARSALATSSRIKNLNNTFQNFSSQGQDFIKSKFSKAKLDVWPTSQDEILLDKTIVNNNNLVDITDREKDSEKQIYEDMENAILDKLQSEKLQNYELWESLGDLYYENNEIEKAREIFEYVKSHSKNEGQVIRISDKIK